MKLIYKYYLLFFIGVWKQKSPKVVAVLSDLIAASDFKDYVRVLRPVNDGTETPVNL